MKATASRRAALAVLRAVRGGELADRAFDREAARAPARDRAWMQELVYGTLRLRGRLDELLSRRVPRGLASVQPDILDVLRLALYQILEMRSVPPYAAVSQAVELAKSVSRGASGFVNGVLHGILRDPLPEAPAARDAHALATWGSHPRWLVDRWIASFGLDAAAAIVDLDNERPDLYLRAVGMSAQDAARVLDAQGIGTIPVEAAPRVLRLADSAHVAAALAAVPAVVQDPAAGWVIDYAAAPAGATVADVCAAPGGKSVAASAGARWVSASDVSFDRMARVRENVTRTGARVLLHVADARRPAVRRADVVLIDAPCTGTGTLRRHPDGKWRLRPQDVGSLAALQREILDSCAEIVEGGGLLVYSTCSLEPEENALQIDRFLQTHYDFRLERCPVPFPDDLLDDQGRLSVLPHARGTDGAFAARLRRA